MNIKKSILDIGVPAVISFIMTSIALKKGFEAGEKAAIRTLVGMVADTDYDLSWEVVHALSGTIARNGKGDPVENVYYNVAYETVSSLRGEA